MTGLLALFALVVSISATHLFEVDERVIHQKTFPGIGPILTAEDSDWSLVYLEDFGKSGLNTNSFNVQEGNGCGLVICGWGGGDSQRYTKDSVVVEDGKLTITAKKIRDMTEAERKKNSAFWLRNGSDYVTTWESGRITTKNKVQGRYGLITFSARLPTGQGVWPALWMLPTNDSVSWPIAGEIDVVEYNQFWQPWVTPATVHYSASKKQPQPDYTTFNDTTAPTNDFKEYSVLWTPDAITFIREGMSIGTYEKQDNVWPFDDSVFHLVLNVAIGPTWGDMPRPDVESFQMDVDSIKWWQRKNYKEWRSESTRRMGVVVPGLPLGISHEKLITTGLS